MPDTSPAVAILPRDIKLGLQPGRIALGRLIWPLGRPDRLGQGMTLADMDPTDHLIVFPRDTLHVRVGFGTRAKVSMMILEPRAIHGHHMRMLRLTHRRFHRVLTGDADLLAQIPNGLFFPLGSTWVPEWRDLDLTKTAMCSLIASAKRSQEGHVLRHDTADWARAEGLAVDVMGQGYTPFGAKAEGLAHYRYSIVIENVRETNYFSEKLIDALLCRTVPIYWGCPNIGDFIDTSGMILCDSADDIHRAVRAMSADDYTTHLPGLAAALPTADAYSDYMGRAALAVLQDAPVPPAPAGPVG